MSDQEDRIKLAEAMGWRLQQEAGSRNHDSRLWLDPDGAGGYFTYALPNPFTDANDDYAVLEFYRNLPKSDIDRTRFMKKLFYTNTSTSYQIGDYARAALEVIENE